MIGQVVASILAGSLRHNGLLLALDILIGIFLLNDDEDFRPIYTLMVGTLFQPCAEQCSGGLNCLCNFVVLNVASFFMGVLFNVPAAVFEVAVAFGVLTLPAPDQATNATAAQTSGFRDMQHHLTQLQRATILLDACCMLLANLAQCVCSVQGARVLSDMANGRSSQAISTFSDDDLFNPGTTGSYTAWRLNRGSRMHHPTIDGVAGIPNNGAAATSSTFTASEPPGGGGGTSSNAGQQQGRTFQSFSGVGYRLE
eukprot:CAMPEP_0172898284 /NCGR_PEP_ID=MMETSP1075-20121228/159374_1 /TAXON_ID=2916 /ORGANISM="Ceratium fusus, Strain PA161109" /LENGTH=254 /DNA_ID=CAMNT_0013754039 /DNA_START=318 /DNA_END=1082 /DNA_ORIENTATION=+